MLTGKLLVSGVLLIWIRVGQGHTALAEGACGVVWKFFSLIYHFLEIFSLIYHFCFLSPSL